MPTPAYCLLIATLLPLASFLLLLFIGKRMGTPLAGYVATAFMVLSFAMGLAGMIAWFNHGQLEGIGWGPGEQPIDLSYAWLPTGSGIGQDHPGFLDVDLYIDSLTIALFNMVTLVALLVHIFSIGYMSQDKRFARFFTYLGLFCFSMLGLLVAGTLLQLFIHWELVGLCSYLLISFWYENPSAYNAGIKAFIINRISDVGFILGMGLLFQSVGNLTLLDLTRWLGSAGSLDGIHASAIHLPNGAVIAGSTLTLIGILFFIGAMGKSAQFPLHVWLPDAMEAPTPISALIHAATMVAAGVYLVARIFPILTPDARLFIAITGMFTLVMGALIATVQSDIKRVLAYSTISQLGYMMLAMGIGSWVGGLFHLITHAFFKALLFLAAGSVIRAANHEQELPDLGGLFRKIPVTAVTFGIGVLAISGAPFFSGYYSKEIILADAGAYAAFAAATGHSPLYWAFFIIPAATAYLTAFYMTRCWMLIFWGKPRDPSLHENAREPGILWHPLIALAGLSILGGSAFLDVKRLLSQSVVETQNYCRAQEPVPFTGFAQTWPVAGDSETDADLLHAQTPEAARAFERGEQLAHAWTLGAFAAGIGLGFFVYRNGYGLSEKMVRVRPIRALHGWLYRGMYFDELYFTVVMGTATALSDISSIFDQYAIDGTIDLLRRGVLCLSRAVGWGDDHVVDGASEGIATLSRDIGAAVRAPQTGRIRTYVTALMIALAAGLAVAVILALIR